MTDEKWRGVTRARVQLSGCNTLEGAETIAERFQQAFTGAGVQAQVRAESPSSIVVSGVTFPEKTEIDIKMFSSLLSLALWCEPSKPYCAIHLRDNQHFAYLLKQELQHCTQDKNEVFKKLNFRKADVPEKAKGQ